MDKTEGGKKKERKKGGGRGERKAEGGTLEGKKEKLVRRAHKKDSKWDTKSEGSRGGDLKGGGLCACRGYILTHLSKCRGGEPGSKDHCVKVGGLGSSLGGLNVERKGQEAIPR